MNTVHVVIPGPPVAQGRGRAVPTPKGIRVMDPKKSRSWKGVAQVHMREAMKEIGERQFIGPMEVRIVAVFPCPKTDHRKRTPRQRRRHTKANADADNLAKAVLDAANCVLFEDDRQVCDLRVEKWIAAQNEAPFVAITARELP